MCIAHRMGKLPGIWLFFFSIGGPWKKTTEHEQKRLTTRLDMVNLAKGWGSGCHYLTAVDESYYEYAASATMDRVRIRSKIQTNLHIP